MIYKHRVIISPTWKSGSFDRLNSTFSTFRNFPWRLLNSQEFKNVFGKYHDAETSSAGFIFRGTVHRDAENSRACFIFRGTVYRDAENSWAGFIFRGTVHHDAENSWACFIFQGTVHRDTENSWACFILRGRFGIMEYSQYFF